MNRIILNIKSKKRIIDFSEIIYVTAHNKKSLLIYLNGDSKKINYSLIEIYEKISILGFVRCHKSFIVNVNYIESFNKLNCTLKNGITVPIGRAYKEDFKKVIYSM